jgi:uncharacterized protein YcbX
MRRKIVPGAVGEMMSTQSASLPYLLGSSTRETRPNMSFSLSPIPSPSFCESRLEAKRAVDSSVMVAKGTPSNDVWSSASVTRKAARTLGSSRREARTVGVTSWRKMISGDFSPSRIWPRMSLAREMAREEKASMFHDMRENLWVTWLCAFLEDTGAHLRIEGLKAERVRHSQLVAMAVVESGKGLKVP